MGVAAYAFFKCIVSGFYTVKPNERAVITTLGKASRLNTVADNSTLTGDETERYSYPAIETVGPGGPYFKWPWQDVHKVNVATQSINLTWDPTKKQSSVEAVTKDNLTTGINGQIRYRICENNLYAYFFGVQRPLEHVMGYFISILRERIANFADPKGQGILSDDDQSGSVVEISEGVSINDLRKNLPLLNNYMEEQCRSTGARYGIELDAALITEIDPPPEVDRALSAINSTRNQVAADISTAKADSEQQITMSRRAVEIASNNAKAEVAPLLKLASILGGIKENGGSSALKAYIRNMRIPLLGKASRIVQVTETVEGGK